MRDVRTAIDDAVLAWKDTPYAAGQAERGRGVDCVRFVYEVLVTSAAMVGAGVDYLPLPRYPQGAAVHDPAYYVWMKRAMFARFPARTIRSPVRSDCRPGDVLGVAIESNPFHAAVVGGDGRSVWHATPPIGVCMTSAEGLFAMFKVRRIFRAHWITQLSGGG